MAQSQYAQISDITSLSLTPQAAARFGEAAITAALQASSSRADAYLVSQYTLPLATDPQGWDMQLTRAVCNWAAFDLYRQYGLNPSAPDFGALKSLAEDATVFMEAIKEKKLTPLYVDSGSVAPGADEGGNFVISSAPVGFTERGLGGNDSLDGNPRGLP